MTGTGTGTGSRRVLSGTSGTDDRCRTIKKGHITCLHKKTLSWIVMVGGLIVGLTACSSGGSDDTGSAPEGESAGGGEAGGLVITIIVNDPANPYWKTEGDLAQAKAEELGYEATVGAHEGDANTPRTR